MCMQLEPLPFCELLNVHMTICSYYDFMSVLINKEEYYYHLMDYREG